MTAAATAQGAITRVAICIVTYRRPRWLADSLRSLGRLEFDAQSVDLTIVVIDNDREAASRSTVEAVRSEIPWGLTYDVEPRQGISFARNRAVRVALEAGAELLAFIDDDETAEADWLAKLISAQRAHGADVVSGPVEPVYGPEVPEWVVSGRFFERPRYSSGTRVGTAITANCLIAARLVAGTSEPFHPSFAVTGGGDTYFFRRLHRAGASIVWANDAIVREQVPNSRATVRWILQRAYRGGTSFAQTERLLHDTPGWMILRIVTGTVRSLSGMLLLVPSLLLGKIRTVRTLQTMCVGLGLLAGTIGFSYREYTVVHGE